MVANRYSSAAASGVAVVSRVRTRTHTDSLAVAVRRMYPV